MSLTDSSESEIQFSGAKSEESTHSQSKDNNRSSKSSINSDSFNQLEVDNQGCSSDDGLLDLKTKKAQTAPLNFDLQGTCNLNNDSANDQPETYDNDEQTSNTDHFQVVVIEKRGRNKKEVEINDEIREKEQEEFEEETKSISLKSSIMSEKISLHSLKIKNEEIISPVPIDIEKYNDIDDLKEYELIENKNSSNLKDVHPNSMKMASISSPPQTHLYKSNEEIKVTPNTKIKNDKEEHLVSPEITTLDKKSNKPSILEDNLEKNPKNQYRGIKKKANNITL